jgi:hypothetical protein
MPGCGDGFANKDGLAYKEVELGLLDFFEDVLELLHLLLEVLDADA